MNNTYTACPYFIQLRLISCLLFFLISFHSAFSQDLKVVYDAEKGAYHYFQNDTEISKPIVKKGGTILLIVKNYNNYLYDVVFEERHEEFKVAQGSGLLGGVNTLSLGSILEPAMNIFDSDADGVIDMIDQEVVTSAGYSIQDRSTMTEAEIRMAKIAALEQRGSASMRHVFDLIEEIELENRTVKTIEEQRILKEIAIDEVQKIKFHPSIPPSKIKSYSESYFEKVLDVEDISSVSLSYLLEKRSDKDKLTTLLNNTRKKQKRYKRELRTLQSISKELESLNARTPSYYNIIEVIEDDASVDAKVESVTQNANTLLESAEKDNLQDLIGIWYEYEAISSNSFSKNFRAQGTGDLVNLDVSLLLKDSLRNTGAAPQINLSTLKVPVYGGIKINASVGINFGQFLTKPQQFFLRDTIIRSESGNQFIPYATSFFHFYKQGRQNVSLGGSLGIGIPLTENTGIQNASFFIGPSLFFGNSERLVLNFGAMGGKVNRLAKGYEVGDVFYNDASFIPIQSVYEIGLFVGLSFNIGG